MTRAAIYTPVSTQEQSEHGYSLQAQLRDCRRFSDRLDAILGGRDANEAAAP
jgi:hypothetical protein